PSRSGASPGSSSTRSCISRCRARWAAYSMRWRCKPAYRRRKPWNRGDLLAPTSGSLLRERGPHAHNRVTNVELFFDLVFVFAITQISHFLLANFTPLGVLEATILMLAVWWVWVFTAWITNWLDPDQTAVRLMLFALMIAGLLLSTS